MYISENVKNLIPFTDLSKIYFVADFDKTITKSDSQSSWSVIAHSKKLPKSYSIERKNLFEYYRPIELDETFDKNEKSILM